MIEISALQLRRIAPFASQRVIAGLVKYLPDELERRKITTELRLCHFLAQAAHETDGFRTLEEYASGRAYEGRYDLGNTKLGDGVRYKGSGIFMLTGRANYRTGGARIGVDLENNPHLAREPEISVKTAGDYWGTRRLNRYADRNDIVGLTRKINGGVNGLTDRKRYFRRAWKIFGDEVARRPVPVLGALPTLRRGSIGPAVKTLQKLLARKTNRRVAIDQIFGPVTDRFVRQFQRNAGLRPDGVVGPKTWAALKR